MRKGPLPRPAAERFWRFVSPEPNTGCWLWTGGINEHGYGVFRLDAEHPTEKAHRVAWFLGKGPIPDGLNVLHKCDVAWCVNHESHLYLGTPVENSRDMVARNRHRTPHFAGANHPRARLSVEGVVRLREKYGRGEATQEELGVLFGIGQAQVSRIVRGEQWKEYRT